MIFHRITILLFLLLASEGMVMSVDLQDNLGQLQTKLGGLKGKLGQLKTTLTELKDVLEGKVPLDHLLEQRLLPGQFYRADAEKTALAIQKKIRKIAEDVGYGYKTANLIELQEVCARVNKMIQKNTGYLFAVPVFAQISSQQIQEFLKNNHLDVVDRWQKLVAEKFPSGEKDLTVAIENKQFPDGFLDGAKVIEDEVKSKFNSLVIGGQELENIIPGLLADQKNDLNDLIAQVNKNKEKCMVRSTGKEDTDKLANAGGNESIANVSSQTKNLLDAIRDVVASYFSAKSLTQRLGAGDKSIIDAPFTPVVMQRMIGEKEGMPLPRCGVMFTEETEGAQSKIFRKNEHGHFIDANDVNVVDDDIQTKARYRDENYKIRTSGITVIQAAFGHNEGVVNSIVPVDTYFIENSVMLIHPIIREKPFRIAPEGEGKLGRKNNDLALANMPVLEPNAVIALKLFANALEDYYKKPMDVEYVILDEGGIKTIYIVQARPIVHNPHQPEPCYLDFDHPDLKLLEKNRGQAIGVGGGTLQFMESKNNLVIKRTIGEALTAYQGKKNPQEIKSIFINEMAPATSHEATTFRGELKPVVSFENDFEQLEAWSNVEPVNLILDAQQQTVIKWSGSDFDFASFEKVARAFKGWINYPLPQQVSVLQSFLPSNQKKAYFVVNNRFFGNNIPPQKSILDFKKKMLANTKENIVVSLRKEIKKIKTGPRQEAAEALKNIWLFLHGMPHRSGYYVRKMSLLYYASLIVHSLLEPMTSVGGRTRLDIGVGDADYLGKRLFLIHFLETLLFQQHDTSVGLQLDSAVKIWGQIREERWGRSQVDSPDSHRSLAAILAKYALDNDLKKPNSLALKWINFVNQLDKNGRSMKDLFSSAKKDKRIVLSSDESLKIKFYQTLKTIGDLDFLKLWINTSFADNQNLSHLINEVDHAKDFLKILLDYKKRIQAVAVAGFENPETFLKNWKDFEVNILNYFVGDGEEDFIKTFSKNNHLGKRAALGVMEELITQFDTAIKAVTGSTQFSVYKGGLEGKTFTQIKDSLALLKEQVVTHKDKIFTFHLMLEKYFDLLQRWYDLSVADGCAWTPYKDGQNDVPIQNVLTKMKTTLSSLEQKTNDVGMLAAKASVGDIAIGLGSEFKRYDISTHEEVFTFVHQSLLNIIVRLMNTYGIKEGNFPPQIQGLHALVGTMTRAGYKTELVGTHFKGNIFTLKYNFPQGLHSALIKIIFNTKTRERTLFFGMYGGNHYARWDRSIDYILYENMIKPNALPVKTNERGVGFDVLWHLGKQTVSENFNWLKGVIDNLCLIAGINDKAKKYFAVSNKYHVINLSARYPRIHSFLNYSLEALSNTDSQVIDNLLHILSMLLDPGSEYARRSEIFLYKLSVRFEEDTPADDIKRYYSINLDNFYHIIPHMQKLNFSKGFPSEKYRHRQVENILYALEKVTNKFSPEQRKRFLKIIETNQDYFAARFNLCAPDLSSEWAIRNEWNFQPDVSKNYFKEIWPIFKVHVDKSLQNKFK